MNDSDCLHLGSFFGGAGGGVGGLGFGVWMKDDLSVSKQRPFLARGKYDGFVSKCCTSIFNCICEIGLRRENYQDFL